MNAGALRCVALLGGLAAIVASCRDVSVCRGTELCEALGGAVGGARGAEGGAATAGLAALGGTGLSPSDGGDGTRGGESGDGGESARGGEGGTNAEPQVCQSPFDNCDETWLNGCETDLSGDADHCGACNAPCAGVCARSTCHATVSLSEQSIEPLGPLGVTADSLYFMSGAAGGPYRLSRIGLLGISPNVIADNLPRLTGLAVAQSGLFLWGEGENLRSVSFAGAVVDQGFEVSAVAPLGAAVFAVSNGALLERKTEASNWETVPWLDSNSDSGVAAVDLWPVAAGDQLVVLRTALDASPAHFDVLLATQPGAPGGGLETLTTASGVPVRVRATEQFVYWLARLNTADAATLELHRHDMSIDTPDQLLTKDPGATDFALDDYFAYASRSLSNGYEVELIPLESIGEKYHFGSRAQLEYPESAAQLLWFFDTSKERLLRVDLGLGQFL